jgi:hypothetical protein
MAKQGERSRTADGSAAEQLEYQAHFVPLIFWAFM